MGMGGKRPGAGRKKGSLGKATIAQRGTLEELARSYTDVALQVLVDVAKSGASEAARVSAANALLDRGYGKPSQHTEITGKDGGDIKVRLTDRQRAQKLAFILARGRASL